MVYDIDMLGLSWEGTSGIPGSQSSEFQSVKKEGPIPEGTYILGNTQSYTPSIFISINILERLNLYSRWEGTGTLGGRKSWGTIRTWLTPTEETNTYGRGGFSIHGGEEPGSAGCIDLTDKNDSFHNWLKSYNDKPIQLRVKY